MLELHREEALSQGPSTNSRVQTGSETHSPLRDVEAREGQSSPKNIIRVWKELKTLRDFQRFTNTPYKLFIRRKPSRKKQKKKRQQEDVDEDERVRKSWIFEHVSSTTTQLAEVCVPVPESSVLTGSAPFEEMEFSSNQESHI
ncbi:Coiled-coil and C2 domain-containing protein 2A [Triplophysa tibetana]|uniref:Coiled-coil and C2 domain-containing protein 2A n=1 Tax=Triplophysa tibetana TaxID=1572043 RepID=A0A5A9MVR0_9TELE|nr:Coiled-coil and C2 domain-containing protein 2A [Triplophysa tibetana]